MTCEALGLRYTLVGIRGRGSVTGGTLGLRYTMLGIRGRGSVTCEALGLRYTLLGIRGRGSVTYQIDTGHLLALLGFSIIRIGQGLVGSVLG